MIKAGLSSEVHEAPVPVLATTVVAVPLSALPSALVRLHVST
jgi:hypothetical protein